MEGDPHQLHHSFGAPPPTNYTSNEAPPQQYYHPPAPHDHHQHHIGHQQQEQYYHHQHHDNQENHHYHHNNYHYSHDNHNGHHHHYELDQVEHYEEREGDAAVEQENNDGPYHPTVNIRQYLQTFNNEDEVSRHTYSTDRFAVMNPEDQSVFVAYILISTSRLKRILRNLQNVTQSVAIAVLQAAEMEEVDFQAFVPLFTEWKVLSEAQQLRDVFFKDPSHQMTAGTMDHMMNQGENHGGDSMMDDRRSSEDGPPSKRRRLLLKEPGEKTKMTDDIDMERNSIRIIVNDYLHYIDTQGPTSFDDMRDGVVESFQYHPAASMKLFNRALAKNRFSFCTYVHTMEPYRQTGQKLDCVKSLRYGNYLSEYEAEQVEQEIEEHIRKMGIYYSKDLNEESPEVQSNTLYKLLKRNWREHRANHYIYEGLIHFFSDGSVDEMIQSFATSLEYDNESIYGYCNLGVLRGFNIDGSPEICQEGIRLLERGVALCTVRDEKTIKSFLHHTIAQIYMRLTDMDTALTYTIYSLEANPLMNLAYLDRNSIFKALGRWGEALADNDILVQMEPETAFEKSNVFCNRAILLQRLNRGEDMREALIRSLEIDSSNSFAYSMLSRLYVASNDQEMFELLKDRVTPKEHLHIRQYLQHVSTSYTNFGLTAEAQQYADVLAKYDQTHFRVE